MPLHTYLPQDRLRAIANNTTLPDRTSGSALFADISGFTAFTESLREKYGARLGAEELTNQLGKVYSALIAEIERYGGSVIGFAGDSMLCWFNAEDKDWGMELRAAHAAFGMQEAIREFPALALKVCIASGDARRFVVGNEEIQRIDALAGATVARTAIGEHLAVKGDVLIDELTFTALGDFVNAIEWREQGSEKFAVIESRKPIERGQSLPNPEPKNVTPESQALRPYVHHVIYERETSGQGGFLAEFRPCVALFIRFTGIDYDSDSAESELDSFIRSIQLTASRYDGTLMDITIGDKGSYAYINFGVLSTHEDDPRRAVKSALEIRNKTELQLQMGITRGLMLAGAYGGETRMTFNAVGDDVNLAARLMTHARENEILVSSHIHKAVNDHFTFEERPAVMVKGKSKPIPSYRLIGESRQRAVRLQEPNYSLPMVGRQAELKRIEEKLDMAKEGKSQVISIVAEAGLGKSRLAAEAIRSARRKGFVGFGGACQSDGLTSPYLAWKTVWSAFFGVDPDAPLKKQVTVLEEVLREHTPNRVEALPLLGPILSLDIPDNDFTRNLEPEQRKNVLTSLLQDCLGAAARSEPILIVLEDLHWVDALSHDLLEALAKALADRPVCYVLAYRRPRLMRLQAPRIEALPYFTKIRLDEFTPAEGEQAVRAKLAQLYPSQSGVVPSLLVDKLMQRSQGNPFYLEELLNYLHDRGLDPHDSTGLARIELPDSLHTLVLSRIDQLSEHEKTTLRAASIIGRFFRAGWLTGYYPALGDLVNVKADLDKLDSLDITPLDSEPELAYLFKHIVTHEVTYESLPFAIRAKLHEQLALYLESIGAPVDMIAQHYGRSNNQGKQREYWLKAGDAAREAFDNEAALDYYKQLYPLVSEPREQASLHFKMAEAYYGKGLLAEAREHLTLALNLIGQPLPGTASQTQTGLLVESMKQFWHRMRFAKDPIPDVIEPGIDKDVMELLRAFELVTLIDQLANQVGPIDYYLGMKILNMAESARCKSPILARAYASLGLGMGHMPAPMQNLAQAYFHRAHATMAGLDHLFTRSFVLWQEGQVALKNGQWEHAEKAYQESVEISNRLGDHRNWATALCVLGWAAHYQGQFELCIKRFAEVYQNGQAANNVEHQVWGLNGQAVSLLRLGKITEAADMMEKVLGLFASIADSGLAEQNTQGILTITYLHEGDLEKARNAAEITTRLLKDALVPIAPSFDSYSNVAYLYLVLWERAETPHEKTEMKSLARQACRALNQFAQIHPIGKSRAFLWQGSYDWLDGKPQSAQKNWGKSLAAAQALSMPYDEALAYREIGRHASGSDRDFNLAHANEIFERLGIAQDANE
ncbi:MAG TPA: hypothetical protein DCX53_05275 [Anaerolineae bacterium]|nr:hypothetical protein [Anaerolineae bacterium]